MNNRGQAVVEFTLCVILMLVVAWIPADFGLMFYTGQLSQNAAREGARVAAADPTMSTQLGTCTMPCSSGSNLLQQVAKRVANGIMSGANTSITLDTPTGSIATCDLRVRVAIGQDYRPFFYKILRMMGMTVRDVVRLNRVATMRYEHQC